MGKRALTVAAVIALAVIAIVVVPRARQRLFGHDAAFFESHPEDLRRVLNECREGGGWTIECDEAESVATY